MISISLKSAHTKISVDIRIVIKLCEDSLYSDKVILGQKFE